MSNFETFDNLSSKENSPSHCGLVEETWGPAASQKDNFSIAESGQANTVQLDLSTNNIYPEEVGTRSWVSHVNHCPTNESSETNNRPTAEANHERPCRVPTNISEIPKPECPTPKGELQAPGDLSKRPVPTRLDPDPTITDRQLLANELKQLITSRNANNALKCQEHLTSAIDRWKNEGGRTAVDEHLKKIAEQLPDGFGLERSYDDKGVHLKLWQSQGLDKPVRTLARFDVKGKPEDNLATELNQLLYRNDNGKEFKEHLTDAISKWKREGGDTAVKRNLENLERDLLTFHQERGVSIKFENQRVEVFKRVFGQNQLQASFDVEEQSKESREVKDFGTRIKDKLPGQLSGTFLNELQALKNAPEKSSAQEASAAKIDKILSRAFEHGGKEGVEELATSVNKLERITGLKIKLSSGDDSPGLIGPTILKVEKGGKQYLRPMSFAYDNKPVVEATRELADAVKDGRFPADSKEFARKVHELLSKTSINCVEECINSRNSKNPIHLERLRDDTVQVKIGAGTIIRIDAKTGELKLKGGLNRK